MRSVVKGHSEKDARGKGVIDKRIIAKRIIRRSVKYS